MLRKMTRLFILSAIIAIGAIVFWSKFLSNSDLVVFHGNEIKVTKSGEITFSWHGHESVQGQLGTLLTNHPEECQDSELCLEWDLQAQLQVEREETGEGAVCYHIHWETTPSTSTLEDCFFMGPAHWYGGGEVEYQRWPLEKWDMSMTPFISADMFLLYPEYSGVYGSVIEPYWLSSSGVGILVESSTPLHVQVKNRQLCLRSSYDNSKYQQPEGYSAVRLDYTLCTGRNVKMVHDYMRKRYLPIPKGLPDERMFTAPIWSTWACYKVFVNESSVMDFARKILDHQFKSSQLELDDGYQVTYGDFTFDPHKFPNPKGLTSDLHKLGYRVTVWIHPFVNPDANAYEEGASQGFFVKDEHGEPGIIKWWNGRGSLIDFTNPAASKWFTDRLRKFQQDSGIDSFKFDAGEANFLPENFRTNSKLVNPGEFTTHYVDAVSTFGPMIEVRAAYKNQENPIFVRMMDKQSSWDWNGGLKTLLTTAITMSLLGYSYVLPDMIGGNAYGDSGFRETYLPDRELFIRWVELSALLPSMQFSIPPWKYDEEVTRISIKWTTFHEEFIAPRVLKIAKEETVVDGSPIIRPLWWIAPDDPHATRIDCEFLVGSDVLVAPVVDRGVRARDVYLPSGKWKEPSGNILTGGKWYSQMKSPIDEILYFIRQ